MRKNVLSPCLLLASIALGSTAVAQSTTWTKVNTANSPPGVWSHATAYDFIRGKLVLFGGSNATPYTNDTWQFDGTNWAKANPAASPPARRLGSMVFHLSRISTLLFGGLSRSGYLGDTWTWNGTKWTQLNPAASPSPRYNAAMAYDSSRGVTVLFGGRSRTGYENDTWEWNGTTWKKITTANSPSGRYTNIVYDVARKKMVLYSGWGTGGIQTDTWEYDGTNWTKMSPTRMPSQRCCVGMAYDIARQRTVIFGGFNGYFQETWEYDGNTWTQMRPTTQPPGRYDFDMMVYDRRRKRIVVFGGISRQNPRYLNDTWEYTGSVALTGTPSTISVATGGTQNLALDAGVGNAARLYWVLGSLTGTAGFNLGSVRVPLTLDFWTVFSLQFANGPVFVTTRGKLDNAGKGTAAIKLPKLPNSAIGATFYHAFVTYDANLAFYFASNAAELRLVQ